MTPDAKSCPGGLLDAWEEDSMSDVSVADVGEKTKLCNELVAEVGKVLVGQEAMISRLLIGLLSSGHVLLEGVPGLAKTLAVRCLARVIDTGFSRIQFTPDMLPADVIGTQVFNPKEGTYSVKKGPIFSNLILADEINRAPAKVQAALLEAMQERQATIGDETHRLEEPFLVLATQNPIEQEGTYPLPEAQVDRFMLKVKVGYPSEQEERKIIDRMASGQPEPEVKQVATPGDLLAARRHVDQILVDDKVRDYIVDLVRASRDPAAAGIGELDGMVELGASPRASIFLTKAAKAHAFLQGRSYATPHDVKNIALDVLRHRVVLTYEAEAEGKTSEDIVERILVGILVP
jgi:MoxR-like ATPase